mmetsp:Transcript_17717/g.53276  ORF Transcript_17717/g.53276 Transcript_17717/m.53276 type:complete len:273 (-) Transcript_17717:1274-2092(-)
MARDAEKAQSTLNRLLQAKQDEARGPAAKRPYLATECHDLVEADKWRGQVIRDIGRQVMAIQNAGLGEHKLRDLNDEINKLIREKGHWERRIVELGGPDYAKSAPKVQDSEGKEIKDGVTGRGGGYRYFGAAKQLPGVRELFEKEPPRKVRRTRHDMYKFIDADYYGFRDEEDGVLAAVEGPAEEKMRAEAIADWERKAAERDAEYSKVAGGVAEGDDPDAEPAFMAYVPLPEQQEIEARVLTKKKADLMAQYASESLLAEQADAKQLLNKK